MDESGTSRVLELYAYNFLLYSHLSVLVFSLYFTLRLVNFFMQTSQ